MANTTVQQELINLALQENEDSSIAKILAYYYSSLNISDKKTFFESLMYYYKTHGEFDFDKLKGQVKIENDLDNFNGKDFRIKSIEIANLRGIPDQETYPFGINFVRNDRIDNAIVLANNGTGKSSLFSGLEMIYAQEVGEKMLRVKNSEALKKKDFDDYIKRLQSDKKPFCSINTNEGEYTLENTIFKKSEHLRLFNPSNHFISDYDIYRHGQLDYAGKANEDNSFHYLLANTLGLGDFMQLESSLNDLAGYSRKTESMSLNKLQKEEAEIKKNIIDWKNAIDEKVKILEEQKSSNKNSKINEQAKRQLAQLRELSEKKVTYEVSLDSYLDSIEIFEKQYEFVEILGLDNHLSQQKDFLELGLDILSDYNDCPFCKSSKKGIDDIHRDVDTRISDLQLSLKEKDKLKEAYLKALDQVNNYHQITQYLYNSIEREIEVFKSYSELSELATNADKLLVGLTFYVEDIDGIWKIVERLTQKNYPKDEDYKSLNDLISSERVQLVQLHKDYFVYVNDYLIQRAKTLEEFIEKSRTKYEESDIEKRIIIIEDEIKRHQNQISEGEKRLIALIPLIDNVKQDISVIKGIKDELQAFLPKYKIIANKLVREAFDPIKDIISSIMSDFLDDKEIELIIETKETPETIDGDLVIRSLIVASIQYIDKNTGEIKTTSPNQYFNTFRYKLFCLMVSLSLALSTRKKYRINLPLVMDDLFYASDFVSKHRFSKFLSKVIELFYKYTPELPLQFILFTHDDLIFRNAIDALNRNAIAIEIEKLCEENRDPLLKKTIIGRIFNFSEKENLKTTIIDNNRSIYNLVYELPQEILNN